MIDEDKTKEQRTGEMVQLNRQIVELKTAKTNRKQVREALLDSEQQFRALIENAQDAIVIVNPDVTIRYESPSMERMTGREAKDRIGKNPFDFCHPDDITKVAEAFIQLLENKIAIAHTELRLQHKNGRWLTFEVIGTNLIDNPVVGGIVLNLRDITERKRVEEALQESEERFRSLVENAPYMIIIADREGKILLINYTASGFSVEDTIGTSVYDYISVEYHDEVSRSINGIFESGEPAAYEITGAGPDGTTSWYSVRLGPIKHDGHIIAVTLMALDITERKRMEEAIQESQEKLRIIFDTIGVGITVVDIAGNIVDVNDTVLRMKGYSRKEVIGRYGLDFVVERDRARATDEMIDFLKGQEDKTPMREVTLLTKDGNEIPCEANCTLLRDKSGNLAGFIIVERDITERKRAEEALRESEERYRMLVETMNDGLAAQDIDGIFTYVNDRLCEMLGFSRDELIGVHLGELLDEVSRNKYKEEMSSRHRGERVPYEIEFTRKDGAKIITRVSPQLITDQEGNIVGSFGVATDITDLKRAEEALRESEERLRNFMESATDVYAIFNSKLELLDVSERGTKVFLPTAKREDMIGKHITEIVPDIKKTGRYQDYLNVIKTGKPFQVDDTIFHAKFAVRHVSLKAFKVGDGMGLVITDITERRQAEKRIKLLSSAVEQSSEGIATCDLEGNLLSANDAWVQMHGYKSDKELLGKNLSMFHTKEQLEQEVTPFNQKLIEKGFNSGEVGHMCRDGTTFPTVMSCNVLKSPQGEPIALVGMAKDITERKRAEEELFRLSNAVRMSTDSIVISDLEAKIVDVNEATLRNYGTDDKGDLIGINAYDLIAPEDREKAIASAKEVLERGYVENQEYHILTKDGSTVLAAMSTAIMKDMDGKPTGFVAVSRDITERKRVEKVLRESEERLSSFMESATDSFTLWDSELNLVEINKVGLDSFPPGTKKEDVIGKNLRDMSPDVEEVGRLEQYLEVMKTGKPFLFEDVVTSPTFGSKHMDVRVFKVSDGLGIIATDITERKKAEKELRESEEFSSSLLDNAPNPVLVINPDISVRYVNPALEKLTGFSNTELVNRKTPYPWWVEETLEETSKDLEEAMSKGAERLEQLFQKKNGERFWVEITSRPIRRHGKLDHYLSNWVDITERKKAEEELRHYSERLRVMAMQLSAAEDNERRRLAQELHDRVGQNLTALSINLSMVRTQLPEEAVAPVSSTLDDSQSILEQTAAIIRDVMSNLQPPVLEEYGLVAALRWYADRFASRTGISVTVQGEDPSPRLNTSSENSLFRIVQETLTNVAKHAQATQVTVTLVAEPKTVRLVVTDDGIGFNTEDVINPDVQKGWGLTTMSERAKSLGGSFDIESRPGHGTRVVVEVGR